MIAVAHIGLIVFIIFTEFVRKKEQAFDFFTIFNVFFCLLYPISVLMLMINGESSKLEVLYGSPSYIVNIQTTLAIFLGYFCVALGFNSKSAKLFGENITIKSRSNTHVIIYAVLLLLFSCIAIYIYGAQYGGILEALSKTILIRSNAVESGSLVFFKHFIRGSFLASYLLASLVLYFKHKPLKFILYPVFIFSVTVSFLAAMLSSGRGFLINYFLAFYLVYLLKTKKVLSWSFIPIVVLAGVFLINGKTFFLSLTALPDGLDAFWKTFNNFLYEEEASESGFSEFMNNFSYTIPSLDHAFEREYQMRLFIDWFYGFIYLIPERIFNITKPESISFYNTFYITGANDYEVPTGLLAFGVYSMWWPGLILVSFIFGWIGRYLQAICNKQFQKIHWAEFIYVFFVQIWIDIFMFGDPKVFVSAHFVSFLSIFLLLALTCKISWIKKNHKTYTI